MADAWAYVLAFLITLGLSGLGVPLAGWLAYRWGVIDVPGPRKVHTRPVPRLGGLAIYGASGVAIVSFLEDKVFVQGAAILVGGSLLAFIGFLDDAGRLHPLVKFLFAMPLAALILIVAGLHATVTPYPWVNYGLTLLWVVGIVSAFNLLDNMDGLCAGVAAVAAFFFLLFALINGQSLVGLLGAAILGAALGFLYHNFHPARIFMGDGGAMFLGFLLAVLGLTLRFPKLPPHVSWVVPVLVLGVPIFDTTLVTISRLRRGLVPFASPGKDHLSHRLYNLGLNTRQVALVHYGLAFLLGGLALWVVRTQPSVPVTYGLLLTLALLALVAIIILERVPFERQEELAPIDDAPSLKRREHSTT